MTETFDRPSRSLADLQDVNTDSDGVAQLSGLSMSTPNEVYEDLSDTEDAMEANLSDEDASSLLEPAISRVATKYKSPKTPAIEKAMVMEELEGGGLFEGPAANETEILPEDSLIPKTKPIDIPIGGTGSATEGMSLGELPSPKSLDPEIPITPWQAGPRQLHVQPTSSLQGVFSTRTRSSSGSSEAFRKLLPKGLPSMAQVSNYFTLAGTSPTRYRSGSNNSRNNLPGTSPGSGASTPRYETTIKTRPSPSILSSQSNGPAKPKVIRRVTSDDSLLYHSLSRQSSLGDDSRFENQREQVNSRAKAIRDSLQDRSSFRMPQMPSLPSMPSMSLSRVPSFSFSMNFLNTASAPAISKSRWRSNTDPVAGILPTHMVKKKSTTPPASETSPPTAAANLARPEAATMDSSFSGSNIDALDRVLETLTGDIVIMGGYRGSILRSTKTNRQLWVPVKVGLNIRKADLEVGLEPEDEERMTETIYPSGMLKNIGPVDISKRLFKRLRECANAKSGKLRVWDYGYDWRLSPHLLSRQLTQFLEKLPSNQAGGGGAMVIAHSLGGLITRHVCNHRPELFSGIVYAGVPKACVNILGPIRNGDAVLLSSRVLTAQVNFTLRTSFVLLPEDGGCFIDINTKERYPVNFFSIDDWIKYRWSPCTDPPLPPRNAPQPGGLGSILNMSNSLLSLPSLPNLPIPGKKSVSGSSTPTLDGSKESQGSPTKTSRAADVLHNVDPTHDRTLGMQMNNNSHPISKVQNASQSVSTTVTIPRPKALAYLERTLAETLKFKRELHYKPSIGDSNAYPPLAIIYGKSIPTVFGAKVDGREGIPCSDSYDNLAFASGDGVCLAKEAMLPDGYRLVSGGRVSSDRGHVTLLGDINAVGRALEAVLRGRAKGIGLGEKREK